MDWIQHKAHRQQVIRDRGVYIGLLDQNGAPIMDIPDPISMKFSTSSIDIDDLEIQLNLLIDRKQKLIHGIADELIAHDIGETDQYGQLVPHDIPTRLILIEGDGWRETYKVSYARVQGVDIPETMTIFCVGLKELLHSTPAPSSLKSWRGTKFHNIDRDWVQPFTKPRDLAEIELAEVADGFSEKGKADQVLARITQDSISAVCAGMGWGEAPHMVVNQQLSGEVSPDITVRIDDRSIWETIRDYALYAGITVSCDMWLPGDKAINGRIYSHPIVVVSFIQQKTELK